MNAHNWISTLGKSLFGKPASRSHKRPNSRRCRPVVEILEDRTVLSPVHWNVDASGNWNDPTNWSTGLVPLPGDDVTINRAVPVTVTIDAATLPVNSLTVANGEMLAMNSGSLSTTNGMTVNSGGEFDFSGGTLSGSDTLTFNGTANWSGGTMSGSGSGLTVAGSLNLTGSGSTFLSGTLNNTGTMTQPNPSSYTILYFNSGAVLNNSGLFDIQENGYSMYPNGGSNSAFNNTGTLQKSGPAAAGVAYIYIPVNNAANGIINVTSGTLSLPGGGVDQGGNFTFSNNAVLDLTGGSNPTLTGNYTGSGSGTISLNSGVLSIGAAGANFSFPQNLFQWTAGTIDASPGTLCI
jgi:hypothetical protein